MLRTSYNYGGTNFDITIPLDTKIGDLPNLIAMQVGSKNIRHRLYFGRSAVGNYHPCNIHVDDSNKDMQIYKICAMMRSQFKKREPYMTEHHIHFPKTKTSISFERTIRVPIDDKKYPLPPTFGSYKLTKIDDEYVLPMYQCEAMWMKFNTNTVCGPIVIKIGCVVMLMLYPAKNGRIMF